MISEDVQCRNALHLSATNVERKNEYAVNDRNLKHVHIVWVTA
jgi:hypothetical protein